MLTKIWPRKYQTLFSRMLDDQGDGWHQILDWMFYYSPNCSCLFCLPSFNQSYKKLELLVRKILFDSYQKGCVGLTLLGNITNIKNIYEFLIQNNVLELLLKSTFLYAYVPRKTLCVLMVVNTFGVCGRRLELQKNAICLTHKCCCYSIGVHLRIQYFHSYTRFRNTLLMYSYTIIALLLFRKNNLFCYILVSNIIPVSIYILDYSETAKNKHARVKTLAFTLSTFCCKILLKFI